MESKLNNKYNISDEELATIKKERELILQKKSKLSRAQRDRILVSYAICEIYGIFKQNENTDE